MRCFFVFALLAVTAGAADAFEPVTPVAEQYSDTATIKGIAITSGTVINVTGYLQSSNMRWRSAAVQNLDATGKIYCSEDVNVCVTEGTACAGWVIAPGTPGTSVAFNLVPGEILYCICNKAGGSCNASLARAR